MTAVLTILLGMLVVVGLTLLTGYFVAQEFAYVAADRSALSAAAEGGDGAADRALRITKRTSFLLSGAQLGITVTGLLVGYVAEPMIGAAIGELLGGAGVPAGVGAVVGLVLALLFSTAVQMVFGELFPKNLAIARPEPVARRLAWSTSLYLSWFGWVIRLFDSASNVLLRTVGIAPVHDVQHAATPRDLARIVSESAETGDMPGELSALLDRTLGLAEATAEHAMIARPDVATVSGDTTVGGVLPLMATGHSRLPVVGGDVDDVLGVVDLRDVLALGGDDLARAVREVARPAVLVPASLPLQQVLGRLRADGQELACVVDEFGGLAGVVTLEDIAEELVGEISDEHDSGGAARPRRAGDGWIMPGTTHIDEAERVLGRVLPHGAYETLSGLVLARLGRLPDPGDVVAVELPRPAGAEPDESGDEISLTVREVQRRVPASVSVILRPASGDRAGAR